MQHLCRHYHEPNIIMLLGCHGGHLPVECVVSQVRHHKLYAKVSKRHLCRSSLHLHAMCRPRPVGESVRALTAFAEWAMRTSCTDVLPATPASCLTCLAFIDTRVALCSPKCIFAWRRGFQRLEVCSHGQVHTRPHWRSNSSNPISSPTLHSILCRCAARICRTCPFLSSRESSGPLRRLLMDLLKEPVWLVPNLQDHHSRKSTTSRRCAATLGCLRSFLARDPRFT